MGWKKKQYQERLTALLKHRKHPLPSQRETRSVGSQIIKGLCNNKSNEPETLYCNHLISSFSGSKSELKSLIEKEVREQMLLVSGQLDQQMKEIVDQHSRVLKSPPLNHKAKK